MIGFKFVNDHLTAFSLSLPHKYSYDFHNKIGEAVKED